MSTSAAKVSECKTLLEEAKKDLAHIQEVLSGAQSKRSSVEGIQKENEKKVKDKKAHLNKTRGDLEEAGRSKTSALSNKTSKEMELSDEQSRLQIANERLGRATKENSKLALILQAKGEVEKSEEKINILNKEISELEKQYNKLVEVFARSEEDLH